MRHLLTPILAILFTTFFLLPNQVMAQAPYKMSYQAVIRDVSGTLIASSPIGMQISILQGSATGVPVFVETHLPSTNVNGLATIEIGNGTLVSGDFTTIDWSSGPYYIKTETDPTGGSTYSITGTSELMSVPYALHAETAANVFSGDYNDLANQPPIPTNTSDLVNDSGFITSPDDADADPTNELNTTVVLSGTNLEVTDAGGTIVTDLSSLSNSGTDDQNLTINNTIGELSIETGNTVQISTIADADGDTKIQVEESADEDQIRFDLAGSEKWVMIESRIEPINAGGSIFIGEEAGKNDDLSTKRNVFIGYTAGRDNTTGSANTFVGGYSGAANINGNSNTFVGSESGSANTIGGANTFIGTKSGNANTIGVDNTFIGAHSGLSLISGTGNTIVGNEAGKSLTAGSYNTLIGEDAGENSMGSYNLYLGGNAAASNTTGSRNTMVGQNVGALSTGSDNVFLGYNCGVFETGSHKLVIDNTNTATPLIYGEFDNNLLRVNGTLNINNAFSFPLTDGTANQVLQTNGTGVLSWTSPTLGTDDQSLTINNATGQLSIETGNTVQISTTADADGDTKIQVEETADEDQIRFDIAGTEKWVMKGSRIEPAGHSSVFIGKDAGLVDDLTNRNTFIGEDAGKANSTGNYNNYIGFNSGLGTTSGSDNTTMGDGSLRGVTTGGANVALGSGTMTNLNTGGSNTALGAYSGNSLTGAGSGNIFLGYYAGPLGISTYSNRLYIHNGEDNNPLIYGEFDNDLLRVNGSLEVKNGNTSAGRVSLYEDGNNGTNKVNIQSPAALSANYTLTLPADAGTANQVLQTNGSGVLSWTTSAAGTDDQSLTINNTTGQLSIETGNTVQISTTADVDGDTKIQVEESADEDQIRFDIAGIEKWVMTGSRLEALNTGSSVFIGEAAGANDDLSDNRNSFIGFNAGKNNTTGDQNCYIGHYAGRLSSTGTKNVAVGVSAGGNSPLAGSNNVFLGHFTGANNRSNSNVFLGYQAGFFNQTGGGNVFLGSSAGSSTISNSNQLYIENSNSNSPLIYGEFDTDKVNINGSFGVGSTDNGGGSRTLSLGNGTVPSASATNGILLYAEDVASSSELKVRDEAGNITTLSPHNFSLTTKSDNMAWAYYSKNPTIGQEINVDMYKVVQIVESLSGEKLVYRKSLETGETIETGITADSMVKKVDEQADEIENLKRSLKILQLELENIKKFMSTQN